MLVLLLTLFSIHSHQAEQATFSKTPLSELMHKSIQEIDSLLKDFQQEIQKEKSVLRAVDLEIQDVGLLDYSLTPEWGGGSLGLNQTGNHTPSTLFPYPPGHFTTTTKDPWESWDLPGLQYYSSTDSPNFFPSSGHQPGVGNPLNKTTPFNPFGTFNRMPLYGPTDMNYSASFTRPSFPFQMPSRTEPTSPEPYMYHISYNASYSPGSPTFRLPTQALLPRPAFLRSVTARPEARTLSEFFAMSDLHKKVMRDRTWRRPRRQRLTKAYRMTATTRRPQQRKRPLSKAQAWVQNRQWKKINKPGRTLQGHMREGNLTEPPITPPPLAVNNPLTNTTPPLDRNSTLNSTASYISFSMPGLTDILPTMSIPGLDEASLPTAQAAASASPSTTRNPFAIDTTTIQTAFTAELFQQDDAGFLFVSSPATIYEPVTESTTNTIGQVLLNADNFTASTPPPAPHHAYHELMETLDEGYLTVFLLELARLITQKVPKDAGDVLAHAEIIYNNLYEQGSLAVFGEEILELGTKVSRMFSGSDISILQSHANMMHQMLTGRAQFLSVEVNSIIDYADLLFEDDEGEDLFEAVRMFEAYPNAGVSSYDVCLYMIESFIKPYRRLRGTDRLRKLIDSVMKVVATKFGNRRAGGDLVWSDAAKRRSGDTATAEPNQTNQKKLNHPSLRRQIETKRHRMKHLRHQQGNQYKHRRQVYDAGPPALRNMLPITKHQKRFRVVTPKQLRSNGYLNMVRPTVAYFRRRLGRPVHPQIGVLQLFPQAGDVEYRRRAEPTDEEPHHIKESSPQQTLGAMRDEVKRIVQESSYSDEEASLKLNLRHALRVNWHKTSTPSMKTSERVDK